MDIAIFRRINMPVIRKSADLRNSYAEISAFCHKYREPVFITRNGEGDLAVMSIETYEEITGKRKLYDLLEEGKKAIKNNKYVTEEEMDKRLDLMQKKMYILKFSEPFFKDIESSVNYIEHTLKTPAAAQRIKDEAKKAYKKIKKTPFMCPIVSDKYLATFGYRFLMVKNYMMFYNVEKKEINIIRFLYGHRDWINILNKTETKNRTRSACEPKIKPKLNQKDIYSKRNTL